MKCSAMLLVYFQQKVINQIVLIKTTGKPIASGSITMENVEFPVFGMDNLGNSMMMPGNNYEFPETWY